MKRFLPIALAALHVLATAQTITPDACGALSKGYVVPIKGDPNFINVKCAPGVLGGVGTFGDWVHQNGGVVAWNYCSDGFGYTWQMAVVTDATLTNPAVYTDWVNVELADDKVAAMDVFRRKYITLSIVDPNLTPIWCPSIKAIITGVPAPIPYVVMLPVTGTVQPIYQASIAFGGVRGSKAIGSVSVKRANGTPTRCNCMTARVVEGPQAYCGISGAMPLGVAACVKQ